VKKDSHIFVYKTMVWQCSTKGHDDEDLFRLDLFQGNFANNNTIRLGGFATVHHENSLVYT